MNIELEKGEVRIHACTALRAKAGDLSDVVYWTEVSNQRGEKVTFFFTTREASQAYAWAINTVSDPEFANAGQDTNADA